MSTEIKPFKPPPLYVYAEKYRNLGCVTYIREMTQTLCAFRPTHIPPPPPHVTPTPPHIASPLD